MAGISLKRLESLSLRELALLLQNDVKDKQLKNVTITEVRITNDLSYMTIYYTTLFHGEREGVAESLERSKGYIRKELAARIKARKMPELRFKYDDMLEYGNHIDEVIAAAMKNNKEEGK